MNCSRMMVASGNPQAETKQSIPDNNTNEVNSNERSEENRNSGVVQGMEKLGDANGRSDNSLRNKSKYSNEVKNVLGEHQREIQDFASRRSESYGIFGEPPSVTSYYGFAETDNRRLSRKEVADTYGIGGKATREVKNILKNCLLIFY